MRYRFAVAIAASLLGLSASAQQPTSPRQTPQSEWYLPTSTGNLAWKAYYAATPKYDSKDQNCVTANELAVKALLQGERCVAQLLALMHQLGHCREQSKKMEDEWSRKSVGCPVP